MASGFDYIEKVYGVRFKRGRRVQVNGNSGTVTNASQGYVRVRFDGKKDSVLCHPTWRLVMLPEIASPDSAGVDGPPSSSKTTVPGSDEHAAEILAQIEAFVKARHTNNPCTEFINFARDTPYF
ncbi:hypothetical protein ACI2KR_31715 [Pseudomonas luteola]